MKIIDTHAHYNSKKFSADQKEILEKMQESCEIIVNVGTNTKSFKEITSLAKKYNFLYSVIGYFPCDVLELEDKNNRDVFMKALEDSKTVAIGEIGLDYYWNTPTPEIQQKYFIEQIELAKKLNLPISIHSRDAETDTLKIIKDHYDENLKGVIHCYSYGLDSAKEYLDMGFYFGIGGTSTYKGNDELRQVIEFLPIENIVLETDCPYLSPVPKRGKRNDSSNLIYVAENIANIKGLSTQEVINITNQNAKKLYNLK